MRRIAPVLAASSSILLGACLIIGPDDSSTTSGSGGGTTSSATASQTSTATGGKGCDGQPTCEACQMCASQTSCADVVALCGQNSACVGLEQCIDLCGSDPDCLQECVDQNQTGVDDYNAKILCLYCDACPTTCVGYATCS